MSENKDIEDISSEDIEKVSSDDIKSVLDSLSDELNKDEDKLLHNVVTHFPDFEADSLDEMHTKYAYTFDKLQRAIARNLIANDHDVVFIFKNYQFLKNHIDRLIKKEEGFACCADKSRTILKHLCNHFVTGDLIDFDYSQEYTFHLPDKVLKTHDEIIELYEALKLTHGGYGEGIDKLHRFHQKLKSK